VAEALAVSAAAVPAAVAQAAVGKREDAMAPEGAMIPEDKIREFVTRIRGAAGPNLVSVILYGSAASGEFHPKYSNLNLFCVLRETSFALLQELAPAAKWWNGQKQPSPLFMSRNELERASDVFAIELLDMQRYHRVLLGTDVLQDLKIPMHLHRVQVEYELREKLILLRQQALLVSESKRDLWALLLHSVSSFTTLFRHALITLGHEAPTDRRQTVQALAKRVGFDPAPLQQVLDVREHKADPAKIEIQDLFARYLAAVEQATTAVDEVLDSDTSGPA
jgi:hypothetical protein